MHYYVHPDGRCFGFEGKSPTMPYCMMLDETIEDYKAKIGYNPTLIVLHPDVFNEWVRECNQFMYFVETESPLPPSEDGTPYAMYCGIRVQSSTRRPRGAALRDIVLGSTLVARENDSLFRAEDDGDKPVKQPTYRGSQLLLHSLKKDEDDNHG